MASKICTILLLKNYKVLQNTKIVKKPHLNFLVEKINIKKINIIPVLKLYR